MSHKCEKPDAWSFYSDRANVWGCFDCGQLWIAGHLGEWRKLSFVIDHRG